MTVKTKKKQVDELLNDTDVKQLRLEMFQDDWQGLPEVLLGALKDRRRTVNSDCMRAAQITNKWLRLWQSCKDIMDMYENHPEETRLLDHMKLTINGAKSRYMKSSEREQYLVDLRQRIDNTINHTRLVSN